VGLSRRQNVYPADTALIFPIAKTGKSRKYHIPDQPPVSAEALTGRPHFRYARFSVAQEKDNQFAPKPGGNRGKIAAAFRWVTIHWVLLRLGIVDRR
jgi:hypothetical protein